jgi:hypothetical protein
MVRTVVGVELKSHGQVPFTCVTGHASRLTATGRQQPVAVTAPFTEVQVSVSPNQL